MKEDITVLVLEYREAIRHLWNSHAKNLDGEHRFCQIQEDYFYFSVLFQANTRIPPDIDTESRHYKHLKVVPCIPLEKLKRIVGTPNNTGGYDFDFVEIEESTQLDLRFIEFIDLEGTREREYEYAMSYILASSDESLLGKVLLVSSISAKYWSTNV